MGIYRQLLIWRAPYRQMRIGRRRVLTERWLTLMRLSKTWRRPERSSKPSVDNSELWDVSLRDYGLSRQRRSPQRSEVSQYPRRRDFRVSRETSTARELLHTFGGHG